jgi:hypothetical protein
VSEQYDTIPVSDSQKLLEQFLENCYGDFAVVKIYTKKASESDKDKETATSYCYEVDLKGDRKTAIASSSNYDAQFGNSFSKELKEQSEKNFELKLQLMKLEIENSNKFDWNKALPILQPLLIGLTKKLNSGPISAPQSQFDAELTSALQKIKDVDANSFQIIRQQIIDLSNGKHIED